MPVQSSLRYTKPKPVASAPSGSDVAFPAGSVREFTFRCTTVGNLVKLCVNHAAGDDRTAAWRPDSIVVLDDNLQRSWTFPCVHWFNNDNGNIHELEPTTEIAAGRRATRRASRSLSGVGLDSTDMSLGNEKSASAHGGNFASLCRRFTGGEAEKSGSAVAKGSGVRKITFRLRKFSKENCHVYVVGSTPLLGEWNIERGLRMVQSTGADGTWRGDWTLDLEMDDDYEELQYQYLLVTHGQKAQYCDGERTLNFSLAPGAAEASNRTTEGGRILVTDTFSSSDPSKHTSRSELRATRRNGASVIQTPSGPATLLSARKNSAIQRKVTSSQSQTDSLQPAVNRNLNFAAEGERELRLLDNDPEQRLLREQNGSHEVVERARARQSPDSPVSSDNVPDGVDDVDEMSARLPPTHAVARSQAQPVAHAAELKELRANISALQMQLSEKTDMLAEAHARLASSKQDSGLTGMADEQLETLAKVDSLERELSQKSDEFAEKDAQLAEGEAQKKSALAALAAHAAKLSAVEAERGSMESQLKAVCGELERTKQETEAIGTGNEDLLEELEDIRRMMTEKAEEFATQQAELVKLSMDGKEERDALLQQLVDERDALHVRWSREFKERRRLFNCLQELRGNIRVFCRVRPPKQADSALAVEFPDAHTGENARIQTNGKGFEFDYVFQPNSTQQNVYDETSGVVASVLDGYNVCVFAYGQTGSGKTHTMNGPEHDRGVNYRALTDLFQMAAQRAEHSSMMIRVAMMEIYNEVLHDLIRVQDNAGSTPKLEIRRDPNGATPNSVFVPGLTEVTVNTVEDVWAVMQRGDLSRTKGSTDMNMHSSRSHLILRISVDSESEKTDTKSAGVLYLVDLAGSERVNRSNVSGDRLREAQHINKSLATLGDVFMSLLTKSPHVPYRNSRLTYLLQDSLGGDSKTLMFVNVSADASDMSETLSSLQFAQRVAKVELGSASKRTSSTTESKATAALGAKDAELTSAHAHVSSLQRDIRKRDQALEEAKQRVRSTESEIKALKASEERRKRDGGERMGSSREIRERKAIEEKRQTEVRNAKLQTREVALSKDEEIRRLKAMLETKDQRIAKLQNRSSSGPSGVSGRPEVGISSAARSLERPTALRTSSARTTRVPQAATFAGRPRQVRFEDPSSSTESTADDTANTVDSSLMPPPPPVPVAARRTTSLPRAKSLAGSRPMRQPQGTVGGAGGAATGKRMVYAFGSRVEVQDSEQSSSNRQSRPSRLPRASTTVMKPALRSSQPPGRTVPGSTGTGTNGSTARSTAPARRELARGATFTNGIGSGAADETTTSATNSGVSEETRENDGV